VIYAVAFLVGAATGWPVWLTAMRNGGYSVAACFSLASGLVVLGFVAIVGATS
jgi:hypothetical protein